MTINEIIFSILNAARGGLVSNTEAISESQLGWQINLVRDKLIRQDLSKKRTISTELIQTLCVDIVQTDTSDCPCEIAGCNILRSTLQIPSPIEMLDRNLIISVGPIDLTKPRFNLIPYYRAIYYNPNKFSDSIYGAFIHNQYLYIISKDSKSSMLEKVNIQIILENPEDAKLFTCSGISCYTADSKYPVSAAMIPDIQLIILQSMIKIEATAPSDQTGDAKHNLASNTEK